MCELYINGANHSDYIYSTSKCLLGCKVQKGEKESSKDAEFKKDDELNGRDDFRDRQDRKDRDERQDTRQNKTDSSSKTADITGQRETGRQTVTDGHADILYSTQRGGGERGLGLSEKGGRRRI